MGNLPGATGTCGSPGVLSHDEINLQQSAPWVKTLRLESTTVVFCEYLQHLYKGRRALLCAPGCGNPLGDVQKASQKSID